MHHNLKYCCFLLTLFASPLQAHEGYISIELCEDVHLGSHETKVIATIADPSLVSLSSNKEPFYMIGKGRRLEGLVQFVWSHVAVQKKGKYVLCALKKPFTSSLKVSSALFKKGVIVSAYGGEKILKEALQKLQAPPAVQKGKKPHERIETPDVVMRNERHVDANKRRSKAHRDGGNSTAAALLREKGDKDSPSERDKGLTQQNAGMQSSTASGDAAQSDSGRRTESTARISTPMRDGSTARSYNASLLQGGIQPALGNNFVGASQISANQPLAAAQISVEMVREGCFPRIDEAQGKVFVQMKTITKRNGVIVEQSECRDSHITFAIQKDYLCEHCSDQVERENKWAFSRYQKYWIDESGRRHNLNDGRLSVDELRPYPFQDEKDWCRPSIDLQNMQAHVQVETVYYNRFNSRQVVNPCHTLEGSSVPITLTPERCAPLHDFTNNRSKERKRAIFRLDNVEHEAFPCEEKGEWIPHEFVKADCRPHVDLQAHTVIQTARRRIQTSSGPQFITQECEPHGNAIALQQTTDGCEGQYIHDFEGAKSYLKKRWFHTLKGYPKFVSGCQQSDENILHHVEIKGYEHNDETRASKAKTTIFIQTSQGRQEISPAQVRSHNPDLPYVFYEEKLVINEQQPSFYEGCHKITLRDKIHVFKRVDESFLTTV